MLLKTIAINLILITLSKGENSLESKFVISPTECAENVSVLFLVHSKPDHFELRRTLRETWLSDQMYEVRNMYCTVQYYKLITVL